MSKDNSELTVGRMRILPRRDTKLTSHPRVKVIGEDDMGFTIIKAKLEPGEDVCWRCGSPAKDPNKEIKSCPECGGNFYD